MYQLDPMFCYCPTTSNAVVRAIAKSCYKSDYMNKLVISLIALCSFTNRIVPGDIQSVACSLQPVACLFSYAVRAPVYDQDFTITVVLYDL